MHLQRRRAPDTRAVRGPFWTTLLLQIVIAHHLHALLAFHLAARGDASTTASPSPSEGRPERQEQQWSQPRIAPSEMQIDARNSTEAGRPLRQDEPLARAQLAPDETATMGKTRQPAGVVPLQARSKSTPDSKRQDGLSGAATALSNVDTNNNTKKTTNDWTTQGAHSVSRAGESNVRLDHQLVTKTTGAGGGTGGPTRRQIISTEQGPGTSKADGGRGARTNQPLNYNNLISQYKLPTWFNFEAYKQLYGKQYRQRPVNELHKRIYLQTSLRVFEQRAKYRARRSHSLASVNELSDMTGEQLAAFKVGPQATANGTNSAGRQAKPFKLPECCSYGQVYARIIELLSATESSNDTELSRALLDELEQKPLVLDQSGADGQDKNERAALMSKLDVRPSNATMNELSGANLAVDEDAEPGPTSSVKSIGQSGLAKGPAQTAATKFLRPVTSSIGGSGSTQGQSTASSGSEQNGGRDSSKDATSKGPDKLLARLVHQANQNESSRHKQPALVSTSTSSSPPSSPPPTSSSSSSHSSGKPKLGTILGGTNTTSAAGDADVSLQRGSKPLAPSSAPASDPIGAKSNLLGGFRLAPSLNRQLAANSNRTSQAAQVSPPIEAAAALHRPLGAIAANNNNDNELRLAAVRRQAARTTRTPSSSSARPNSGVSGNTKDSSGGGGKHEQADDEEATPQVGVPPELEEAVRWQVAQQLSPQSPFGRLINKQLSDYFGEQVEIQTPVSKSSTGPNRKAAGPQAVAPPAS